MFTYTYRPQSGRCLLIESVILFQFMILLIKISKTWFITDKHNYFENSPTHMLDDSVVIGSCCISTYLLYIHVQCIHMYVRVFYDILTSIFKTNKKLKLSNVLPMLYKQHTLGFWSAFLQIKHNLQIQLTT
jgi:hypothetical protein